MAIAGADIRPDRVARVVGFILLSTFFTALQDAIINYASADATLWHLYVLRSLFLIASAMARRDGSVWLRE